MIGYVFEESWAAKPRCGGSFHRVTRKAKEILVASDAEWTRIAPMVGARDQATLEIYRNRYRDGVPRRPIADEEADARVLFGVLASLGGAALVGPTNELARGPSIGPPPGTDMVRLGSLVLLVATWYVGRCLPASACCRALRRCLCRDRGSAVRRAFSASRRDPCARLSRLRPGDDDRHHDRPREWTGSGSGQAGRSLARVLLNLPRSSSSCSPTSGAG